MYSRFFEYKRAASLDDACEILRRRGEGAKIIAGGQSLLPLMNVGLARPDVVVDISRVQEARQLELEDGFLVIGALNTYRDLIGNSLVKSLQPLIPAAARNVGNARVQNRGTVGGSLAHSDPAAELPLVMTALGATYEITDSRSTRNVRAEEFATSYFTTLLQADELVVGARVPILGPEWGWSFQEMSRRRGDFAVVAVAALIRSSGGSIVESRVAIGGVGPYAFRLAVVESLLSGSTGAEIRERVGPIDGISPLTDASASSSYRRDLSRVLVVRAIEEAFQRSMEVQ